MDQSFILSGDTSGRGGASFIYKDAITFINACLRKITVSFLLNTSACDFFLFFFFTLWSFAIQKAVIIPRVCSNPKPVDFSAHFISSDTLQAFFFSPSSGLYAKTITTFRLLSSVASCCSTSASPYLESRIKRFDVLLPCLPWCHAAIFSLPEERRKGG